MIPEGTEAITGAGVAKENAEAIKENFKIVGIVFGAFAGIALFVGSFIIWNTFTMTVTQRSREIALLRAIGARRRQVMSSLLLEAVLLGVVGSAIGLGLGVAVAKGLKTLMDAVGLALPFTTLQIETRTIWVSLLVGHRRHRGRRAGSGPARHQGAADRGTARVDPRCGEALEEAGHHRSRPFSPPERPACCRRCTPTRA